MRRPGAIDAAIAAPRTRVGRRGNGVPRTRVGRRGNGVPRTHEAQQRAPCARDSRPLVADKSVHSRAVCSTPLQWSGPNRSFLDRFAPHESAQSAWRAKRALRCMPRGVLGGRFASAAGCAPAGGFPNAAGVANAPCWSTRWPCGYDRAALQSPPDDDFLFWTQPRLCPADSCSMPFAEHLVARSRDVGGPSLLEMDRAAWLWARLRQRFPDALACVLMPDHVHLLAPPGRVRQFRGVLGAFSVQFGTRFEVIAQPANTAAIALRNARYCFLNPVRAGLVADPWMWPWSTLRDLAGAAWPIWTASGDLAARFGYASARALLEAVTRTAEASPKPPAHAPIRIATPEAILRAVASTCRQRPNEVTQRPLSRRLAVQTWCALGVHSKVTVGAELGLSRFAVKRLCVPLHPALAAVLLCLSDERLLLGGPR